MARQLDHNAMEDALTDLRGDNLLLELARSGFVDGPHTDAKVLQADATAALLHAVRRIDEAVAKACAVFWDEARST